MKQKQRYLYRYNSLQEILDKNSKALDWKIVDENVSKRSEKTENYKFFQKIKKDAKKIYYGIDNEEIISWLDSLTILNKLVNSKKLSEKIKQNITIFQEYLIPYSNNYRTDYLLCLANKILILEFKYTRKGTAKKYDEKLFQALRYKEVLQTILPRDYIIGQFIFFYYPEYDKNITTKIKNNIKKNETTLNTLIKLIANFFDVKSASEMLDSLE